MKPAAFNYHSPTSAEDAVSLMAEYEDAELLAGNQSLGVQMANRLATPAHLIDLNEIEDLKYINETDDGIEIGALTRHATIADSDLLDRQLPVLAEAAGEIAGPSVRNMGTLGGSLGEADPAGNYPTVLMALDATLTLQGPDGTREEDVQDFHIAYMMTTLAEDEMIVGATIPTDPLPPGRTGMSFQEIKRVPHTWPKLSAAAAVVVDNPTADEPTVEEARLSFGNAADTPLRTADAEDAVEGTALSESALADAAEAAMDASEPASEMQADADYKEDQIRVFARRTLQAAYDDALQD
ncbi:FAD binding domain-containing protein [Natrinema gelatinilyticum]|uniref:FAD binding domain-containing protein n=1 Tax=Natrinema gelatinilyticum TaxID=2961571 RepID=UPI0021143E9E|nr:FAD binding domain-containing protein [Natrinema gelatinilyticum]